ncbi:hypothetical protein [Spirosoma flavum]|uniref:Urease accessory protein UreH-like transmembrane domain-containing protein n=1 Tax=Spirosoma flavum TaxID=2048557 RepID=A0ABW6AFE0_9BACT
MKNLSRWASQHGRTAIALLILCEVCNAINGLLLGMNLLENWPAGCLLLLILGFAVGAFFIQTQSARVANQSYWVGRKWLFGAFIINFFLFILLGGFWATSIQKPTFSQTAWGSRKIEVQSDTITPPSTLKSPNPAYYEDRSAVQEQPIRNQAGKRIGFVLLFLLGIVLSGYAVGLACSLACAGNGLLAFMVGLLGSGIFVSSFFLLSRAFDKIIKPWKLMNRPERKRVYLRALLLLLGFWIVSTLLGRLAN